MDEQFGWIWQAADNMLRLFDQGQYNPTHESVALTEETLVRIPLQHLKNDIKNEIWSQTLSFYL